MNGGDEPIYPGSGVTKAQTILMMLIFILRHRLSGEGLSDFLTMQHILFPATLPATKYLFDKCFVSIVLRSTSTVNLAMSTFVRTANWLICVQNANSLSTTP